jgi:hypothetical protein
VEIKVGVTNVAREVTVESPSTSAEVIKQFQLALKDDEVLVLQDEKGRVVAIPAAQIGYIDFGSEHARRVGFGQVSN